MLCSFPIMVTTPELKFLPKVSTQPSLIFVLSRLVAIVGRASIMKTGYKLQALQDRRDVEAGLVSRKRYIMYGGFVC